MAWFMHIILYYMIPLCIVQLHVMHILVVVVTSVHALWLKYAGVGSSGFSSWHNDMLAWPIIASQLTYNILISAVEVV